ncbi:MAG TPA: mandelate racemase/muconate lactonizing enzyme family protein [Thermoleophilaceae bacterium]|nr:mandelate racemase/muconate lactonizing enzyme family protein [Thermoleophilaceae bacterium]
MRITAIRLRRVARELDPPFAAAWDPVPRRRFEATIVVVETDEGLTGFGSGDTMDGFGAYEHLFVGRDPLDVQHHARVLETIAFHAGRYWPLEAALWDLLGKARGEPVATLLGGAVNRLPLYASTGAIRPPGERAELALRLRDEGFRALKIRVEPEGLEEGVASVAAVRHAVGDTMEIMVDLNQAWRMPGDVREPLPYKTVRGLADALDAHGVRWLEEPLPGEDVAGLAQLRRESGVPVAGGEMARTPALLDAYLEADALDVYQPDAVLAVGVTRARNLGRRVLERGLAFTPHTWTNGIGLLANLHLSAGIGGGPYLEFPYDPPGWTPERRDFMLAEPIVPDADGCLAVPAAPGLGVELDG